jgi:hypothetical protein
METLYPDSNTRGWDFSHPVSISAFSVTISAWLWPSALVLFSGGIRATDRYPKEGRPSDQTPPDFQEIVLQQVAKASVKSKQVSSLPGPQTSGFSPDVTVIQFFTVFSKMRGWLTG